MTPTTQGTRQQEGPTRRLKGHGGEGARRTPAKLTDGSSEDSDGAKDEGNDGSRDDVARKAPDEVPGEPKDGQESGQNVLTIRKKGVVSTAIFVSA